MVDIWVVGREDGWKGGGRELSREALGMTVAAYG
jgi:hypothetical protein